MTSLTVERGMRGVGDNIATNGSDTSFLQFVISLFTEVQYIILSCVNILSLRTASN